MAARYPKLSLTWSNLHEQLFKISQVVNGILNGQTNNLLSVTLRPNETTTEIVDDRIHPATIPVLVAQTANAAAEAWSYASSKGKVTITHGSSATADRTFGVLLCG